MNVVEKPRIGNGLVYFVVAGSLVVLSVVTSTLDLGEGRDPRAFAAVAGALAAVAAAIGFFVRLFGLIERRLIEVQMAVRPADQRPASGPLPSPVGVDRYGLPLRPSEIGAPGPVAS